MNELVVDASVGIKLFLDEDKSENARDMFAAFAAEAIDCVFVPDLFFIECTNILWKRVRRGELPEDLAIGYLVDLKNLSLPTVPSSDLMLRALEIACAHSISAYDACYVALAENKGASLITADERLANGLAGSSHQIQLL